MAGKKRTDKKGRVLRTGEMQRSEDNRYMYRYTHLDFSQIQRRMEEVQEYIRIG